MTAPLARFAFSPIAFTLIACPMLVSVAAAQSVDLTGWGAQVFDSRWESQDFVALDAGEAHVLALRPDGGIVAWGANASMECEVPDLPAGLTYLQVSAGFIGSAAVRSDGLVVSWGSGVWGNNNVPALPAGTSYLQVSTGTYHKAALRSDGQVVCWGNNTSGQCTVPPLPAGTTYIDVSAGGTHTLALRSDGQIVAWGQNSNGQSSPPPAFPGKTPVAVDAGRDHSGALYDDGSVECWGANSDGQCDVPALAAGLTYVQVSLANRHTLGLVSDGTVRTWGLRAYGLADIPVLPAGVTYTQVSAGNYAFSVALRSDQRYEAWGETYSSQTNVPDFPAGTQPVDVVAAANSTLALLSDGTIASWGDAANLQFPPPPAGQRYERIAAPKSGFNGLAALLDGGQIVVVNGPVPPTLPAGSVYVEVEAGDTHYLALRDDGEVVTWGASPSLPWMIVPPLPAGLAYTAVRGGANHSAALRSDGNVVCWGSNGAGQLNVPALPGGTIYVELEAGSSFNVARRSDGVLMRWGIPMEAPPTSASGEAFVDVDAGTDFGLARVSDGSVVGWGNSQHGKSDVPLQPPGTWISAVSAGVLHSAAVRRSDSPCGGYVTYCGVPAVNSTGAAARLELAGCAGLTANGLSVEVGGLPPGQLGILIYASGVAAVPFGDGTLCLGGQVVRVLPPLVADASGSAGASLDLSQPPFSGGQGHVLPGSLWNFQFWYRDPAAGGAGFNLSDAAHVVFAP